MEPEMPHRVLIVDNDPNIAGFLMEGLVESGYEVVIAQGGREGIALLREEDFDAVVSELRMPEVDGLDLLRFAKTLTPPPAFLVMTGYGSVEVAVKAMKYGAVDFVEKPVSAVEVREVLHGAITKNETSNQKNKLPHTESGIIGDRRWVKPFMDCLRRISNTDATVLIQGETGTGKSLVAREIWRQSTRMDGPFVDVNCASIPEHLIESELFGHMRGSFTGATTSRVGKVEAAQGGTLFLDEVGELQLNLQAKLLHLLQEFTYQPIGSSKTRRADVRIIAATNRDLWHEVECKRYRADLYYRLNVVSLTVPPLRDRQNDVPLLIDHFRERVAHRLKTPVPRFASESIRMLTRYNWPGNIRELENLVQRVAVIYPPSTTITTEHLQEQIQFAPYQMAFEGVLEGGAPVTGSLGLEGMAPPRRALPPVVEEVLPPLDRKLPLAEAVKAYERSLIQQALGECEGNRSQAAKVLGTKRTTLIEKMKRHGLDATDSLGL
jgi:DNA-binding NtrC family response regulator